MVTSVKVDVITLTLALTLKDGVGKNSQSATEPY